MQIPTNLTDPDSHFKGTRSRKSFNVTKTAVLYDLVDPTIAIADRNYKRCDTMTKLERRGLKYRLRAREHKGIASGLAPPGTEEFDIQVDLLLTRKENIRTIPRLKERNKYRFIPKALRFDILSPDSNDFYHLPFRITRVKLAKFPLAELKKLYARSWGAETPFRELKHAVGLLYFHSKRSALPPRDLCAADDVQFHRVITD